MECIAVACSLCAYLHIRFCFLYCITCNEGWDKQQCNDFESLHPFIRIRVSCVYFYRRFLFMSIAFCFICCRVSNLDYALNRALGSVTLLVESSRD